MSIIQTIKFYIVLFCLGLVYFLLTASVQAETAQIFDCNTVSEIPVNECEALVAIYNNMDGENWDYNTGWLATDAPCGWYRVFCSDGHVTKLDLHGEEVEGRPSDRFGLSGDIPAEIGNLVHLRHLDLSVNEIETLPAEIGMLSNLSVLNFNFNKLRLLPAEIGKLSNLTELKLKENELGTNTISTEIGELSQLTVLVLSENDLENIPSTIVNLSKLKSLDISINSLSGLPVGIENLSRLEQLYLSGNKLSTLPEEIFNLSSLMNLDIAANELDELSDGIGNLTGLSALELSNNQLSILPRMIMDISGLEALGLRNNHLTNLDQDLGNWIGQYDGEWRDHQTEKPTPTATATFTPIPTFTDTPIPTSTPTSIIPTPLPTAVPPGEPNDTCDSATEISTDDTRQRYTFYIADDEDWIRFDATAGTYYRIEITVPIGSRADVDSEIHPTCGTLPLGEDWSGTFGPGSRLIHKAEQDGPIYLRLANVDDAIFGADVSYQLSVQAISPEPPENRALIIVAGRLKQSDPLQDNIHKVTDEVFELFINKSYTEENIYYLATDANLTGYDTAATLDNIRLAITQWAMERLESNGVLTLYIMDHGEENKLFIDKDEILTPDKLDEWLTELEEAKPGLKVNVFLEACHIGSFIEGDSSISKKNRVIITSSNVDWDAYASQSGAYFSDYFLTSLSQGRNLFDSFFEAREDVRRLIPFQDPWLDANGNGIHNEGEDWVIASRRGFAYANTLSSDNWQPYIVGATGHADSLSGIGTIEAEVRDDVRVEGVWAVIYPPSYRPEESRTGELVQETWLSIKLQAAAVDNQYTVDYAAFNEIGTYRIVVHAEDNAGLLARPYVFHIHKTNIFMPIIRQ